MQKAIHLIALALAVTLAAPLVSGSGGASDLLALWLAGVKVAGGDPAGIYPAVADVFLIRPPDDWQPLADATGHRGPVYPYIYPPIWAWVVAPLTRVMSFQTFATLVASGNVVFMGLAPWLAWRACGRPLSGLGFFAIGQIVLYGSLIGALAVFEDQPQILVSLLVVLVIERMQAGAPVAAGLALALAAAIKLSPALLIVPLLGLPGGPRALLAFALGGTALGLASLGVAGWPLHAHFLALVSSISDTAIGIGASFGFDRAVAELFAMDHARPIEAMTTDTDPPPGWLVFRKSPLWAAVGQGALLACLLALTLILRRVPAERRAASVWPAGLIALTLLAPVAWMHYFIAPLAFAPVLLSRLGPAVGTLVLLITLAPFSFAGLRVLTPLGVDPVQNPVWGATAMTLLAIAFAVPRRSRLHVARSSL